MSENSSAQRADAAIAWLRDYAARRLDLDLWDERRCIPPHVAQDFARAGLFGLPGETEFGGLALCPSDCLRVSEQLGAIDLSLSIAFLLQSFLVTAPIRDFATPEQKARWVPELVSGRVLGSYCLTERGAGSDPRRIQTSARQQTNGDWILNGEKIWSGNAAWAGVLVVFARAFDESGKELGISAFVVDRDTPGVIQGPEARTMGLRLMVQNSMRFDNVCLQSQHLLGKAGAGLAIGHGAMMFARLVIAAICLGAIKRCLNRVLTYVRQRKISTGSMAQNPTVLRQLQDCFSNALALEVLVEHASKTLDAGKTLPDEFYAALKVLAPEMLGRTVDTCLQLLGGRGYIETNGIARFYRDARILRIFEGPTQTLAAFLGARLRADAAPFVECLRALGGAENADSLTVLLSEWDDETATLPLDAQRGYLSLGQVLVGQLGAQALVLAALRCHPQATDAMKAEANAHWQSRRNAFFREVKHVVGEDILGEIENFCAPIGDILPFCAGEGWASDLVEP